MKWGIVLGWILLVAQGGGVRGGVLSEGSLETRLLRDRPTVGNGIREERLFEAGIASYLRDLLVKFPTGPALRDGLSPNVGEHCLGHTLEWILQLTQLLNGTSPDLWALHMFDAFGKFPEGILSGHVNPLGDYDECVGIRASDVAFSQPIQDQFPQLPTSFSGLYCNVYIVPRPSDDGSRSESDSHSRTNNPPADLSRESVSPAELLELMAIDEGIFIIPSLAMCFPSTCSALDVGNLTINALSLLGLGDSLMPAPNPACTTGIKPDLDVADISVIALLGVLVGLCLFAAGVDMWMNRGEGKPSKPGLALQYLFAFSAYTNTRKWLSTRKSGDDLGCIHGIRVLSTSWVVLGHTWYMVSFMPMWNMVDIKKLHSDWTILTVLNSSISVDTFFVMSGMLVAYNLLKLLEKSNGRFNLPMFYIHRYLRITPTYALLVGIMATVFPYFGSGPFWSVMDFWSTNCELNWWNNLLYINNFINVDRLCQGEAWFLACDMQFYILSPLFIYPLWRWKKLGLGILLVSTIASILTPALVVYNQEVLAPTSIAFRYQANFFAELYIKPHTRIQTYLVGIALGYLLFELRGKKVRIPKIVVLTGWVVAVSTALAVLYGIFPWFNPATEIELLPATIYGGLNRFAWGVSVSWVIFACVKGYGGLINDFLSWKVFMPLGRLCFCVYLVSLHLQMTLHLSFRQTITYDTYTMVNFFLAHLMLSFLVGFLCTLTLESPFIIVEKLLFEGGAQAPAPRIPELKRPAERYGIYYQSQETSINAEKIPKTEL